ncbi:MAG: putative porin [Desulfocapsaceae bacterium]|nr:putative porin [Desulfocapsaceae bacterium]
MKKVLSTVAALGFCLYLPAAALAGGSTSNDAILRELQELRAQVSNQQAEIDMLKGQKTSAPADMEYVKTKVAAQGEHIEALEAKKGFAVSGNEFIDGIKLKGDLRVRYEMRDKEYKDGMGTDLTRERFRTRFRLGGVWDNKAENWQMGAGLASGSDDPTSTNDTWSEVKPFETGDIRLDYAYAKHKWNDFSMTLGQAENPYKTSWVLWDGDVRLAGMTLAYGQKEGVFAMGGAYGAKLVMDDDTSMLYMGQVGYNGTFSEKGKFTVATGYHTYGKEMINEEYALDHDAADLDTKSAFGLGSVDPNTYELNIGDIYGDVSFPAGPVKLKMYGQAWMNFGADGAHGQAGSKFPELPEDNNMGWVAGIDGTFNDFKLGYAYSVVEADSLFGYLSDSDFGDGLSKTNKQGHRVQLGYSLTKNWSTDFTFLNFERVEDFASAKEDQVSIYQIDVNYKF